MIVVMDAGHGGYDPGAVNGDRQEKDDNLRLTLAIGRTLQSCGVDVIYTRDTDEFIPLIDRARISNNANADLFVSIHRNSSTNANANGFEVHVYTNPSAKAVELAENIVQEVGDNCVNSNRGVQRSNLSVLRNTVAPAVLVEVLFISNEEDNMLFDSCFEGFVLRISEGILKTLGINCEEVDIGLGENGTVTTPIAPITPPNNGETSSTTIKNIQNTLNSKYDAGITVDGIWGTSSHRALIRALQTELNREGANLLVDGIWGPRTRAAVRLIRQGDRGNLVWLLQAALYVKGYKTNLDGIFGPDTDRVVREFQRSQGLSVDGIAGPNTIERAFT